MRLDEDGDNMTMTTTSRSSERVAYSVDEVAVRAGIGRDAVYDAIREKRLVARKWGRRTLITDSALRAFLESLPIATLDRQPERDA
jgi:excisionase family DNA binding protein